MRLDTPLDEALERIRAGRLPGLIVRDPDGRPVGVIGRRSACAPTAGDEPDFYRDAPPPCWPAQGAPGQTPSSSAVVGDVVSRVLIAVPADTPLARVAALLSRLAIDRIIVTGPEGFVGILEALDVLSLVARGQVTPDAT